MNDYDKVKEGYNLEKHLNKANEEFRPYHYKAYLTFTKLLLELGFKQDFINQITSKYTDSSVLETLKLMIRSKRFFRTRPKLFELFYMLDYLENEMRAFKALVEKHDSFQVLQQDLQDL